MKRTFATDVLGAAVIATIINVIAALIYFAVRASGISSVHIPWWLWACGWIFFYLKYFFKFRGETIAEGGR